MVALGSALWLAARAASCKDFMTPGTIITGFFIRGCTGVSLLVKGFAGCHLYDTAGPPCVTPRTSAPYGHGQRPPSECHH